MVEQEVIIVEATNEPLTYFIFRDLGNENYLEIKFLINPKQKTIKCSQPLLPHEVSFITQNIIDATYKLDSSITNTNWYDSLSIKKTYAKIQ